MKLCDRLPIGQLAGALLGLLCTSPMDAQGIPISLHFGALSLPVNETKWEFGFSTDRFTNQTKASDSLAAVRLGLEDSKTRRYALQSAIASNTFYLSHSHRWRQLGSVVQVGGFGGWAGNQPSSFFQNNFRHRDLGIDFVPVDSVTTGKIAGAFAGVDRWVDMMPRNTYLKLGGYGGIAAVGSNLYSELALRFGVVTSDVRIGSWMYPPRFAVGLKKGLFVRPGPLLLSAPRDSGAIARDLLANTYTATTGAITLPTSDWLRNRSLVPDIEVGFSSHTGLFLARKHGDQLKMDPSERGFHRMPDTFETFALVWAGGDVALETYNDAAGNKDIGPTFGARLYVRWGYWGKPK